jgi:hypothetical protein
MGNAISIPEIDRILSSLDAIASSNCPPAEFYAAWFGQLASSVNASYACSVVPVSQDQWAIQCRYLNVLSSHSIEQHLYRDVLPNWGSDYIYTSKDGSGNSDENAGFWRGWMLSKTDPKASRILLFWKKEPLSDSAMESVLDGFMEIAQNYYHESTTSRMRRLLAEWNQSIGRLRRAPSVRVRDAAWITALQSVTHSDRGVLLQQNLDDGYRCIGISNSLEFSKGGAHLQYEKLALECLRAPNASEKLTRLLQFQTDRQLSAVQIVDLPDSKDVIILEWGSRPAYENSVDSISWLLPMIENARWDSNRLNKPSWIRQNWMLCLFMVVLLGIAVAAGTSTELYVEAEGTLQPQRHQALFVPVDGFIQEWYVHDGQKVRAGDKLVDIQSPTLDSHLQQLQHELLMSDEKKNGLNLLLAQLSTETSNETSTTAGRLAGEIQELEQTKVNLRERIDLAHKEKERLQLVSLIDGTVVTTSLELDQSVVPVRRGDAIVRVVDTHGPWLVEANIADEDLGVLPPVDALKKLQFNIVRTTGTTDATIHGTLQNFASTLRPSNSRPVLVATFSTTLQQSNLRPGSSVHVYIPCGQARRWYIWTRPLIQSFQRRFWIL